MPTAEDKNGTGKGMGIGISILECNEAIKAMCTSLIWCGFPTAVTTTSLFSATSLTLSYRFSFSTISALPYCKHKYIRRLTKRKYHGLGRLTNSFRLPSVQSIWSIKVPIIIDVMLKFGGDLTETVSVTLRVNRL